MRQYFFIFAVLGISDLQLKEKDGSGRNTINYLQKINQKSMDYLGTWGGDFHLTNEHGDSTDTISVVLRIHRLDAKTKKVLVTLDARKSDRDRVYGKKEYTGYLNGSNLNLVFVIPEYDLTFSINLNTYSKADNFLIMSGLSEAINEKGDKVLISLFKIDNNTADHVKPEGVDFKIIEHPLNISY
jgi:hypothetical protein